MELIKNICRLPVKLWLALPDWARRVLHTLWQALGGALLVGLTAAQSAHDVQGALFIVYTTGLAAFKASFLKVVTSYLTRG